MLLATLLAPSTACDDSKPTTDDASPDDGGSPAIDADSFLNCDPLDSHPTLTEEFIARQRRDQTLLSNGLVCVFLGCGVTEIVFPTRNTQCGFSSVGIGGYDGEVFVFDADHRQIGQFHSQDTGSHCEGVVPRCRHLDGCELDPNFTETGHKLCLWKTDAGGNGDDAGSEDDAGR